MPDLSRIGRTLGIAMSSAIGLIGVGALAALRRSLPRTSGVIHLPGLQNRAHVLRDRWGVPHIYATTNADLMAALGYVHAQDRLWQMELNRRMGHGQLAELFGPIALSSDRFARVLGLSRVARREVELLDDDTRSTVEAYIRGINAFLASAEGRLPLEFTLLRQRPRLWEAADVLVWGKVLALNLSWNWMTELLNARLVAAVGEQRARELMPRYPDDHPITVPAGVSYRHDIGASALAMAAKAARFLPNAEAGQGSNAWVIGGQRSATGKPLLANDTHLKVLLPPIWYEAHLEGGDYAVTGASLPGIPGILIGHNAQIAWGMTTAMIDVQDLYLERFHSDDRLRYAWQGAWEQVELVQEVIAIKGRQEPQVEDVLITRHGPVITSVAAPDSVPTGGDAPAHQAEELALRWTALEPGQIVRAVMGLNRARNWGEFRAALVDWDAPPMNVVYADVEGHYGYALAGRIPIRARGDGLVPVPGWEGSYEWIGTIPAQELPSAYDPPESLVVTANNRIAGDTYGYNAALQGEWWNGYRATRIHELLEATPHHDVPSFARMQRDQRSLPGLKLARLLTQLPLQDRLETQARDLLANWDGDLSPESIGGVIYAAIRYQLERRVYAELGDLQSAQAGLGLFGALPGNDYLQRALPGILDHLEAVKDIDRPDAWLGGRSWAAVLHETITLAVAEVRQQLGDDPRRWRYGRIHTLTLRHSLDSVPLLARLFNRGPWPIGGDVDTLWMAYFPRDNAAGPRYVAPAYRQICDPANWDTSCSILPGGQSGQLGSRHYNDMTAAWRTGKYHPMCWSRSLVERHTVARLTLDPER